MSLTTESPSGLPEDEDEIIPLGAPLDEDEDGDDDEVLPGFPEGEPDTAGYPPAETRTHERELHEGLPTPSSASATSAATSPSGVCSAASTCGCSPRSRSAALVIGPIDTIR